MNNKLQFFLMLCFASCAFPPPPSPDFLAQRETKIRQLLTLGVMELQSADAEAIERAGRTFELARELDAKDPRVLDGLGCYYFRKDELGLAKFYFQRALEIEPNYDRALGHLAFVAVKDGNIETGRELLQRSVEMNPLNYQQRNNLAALGIEFGDRGGFDILLTEREITRAKQSAPLDEPIIKNNLQRLLIQPQQ